MPGLPQGPLHRGFRAIVYYCRDDPRVFIYKHSRWKWMGVTLNFAHPVSFRIVLTCCVTLLLCLLPGALLQNAVWIFSGLGLWTFLLIRYFFQNAERDFRQYAGEETGHGKD